MTTHTRREILGAGVALGLAGRSSAAKRGYSHAEVEKLLASGAPGGKITKDDLCTPALLLDMERFEANLAKMAGHVRGKGRGLRPHAKTHKCPDIARAQIKSGASGVCTAKLS